MERSGASPDGSHGQAASSVRLIGSVLIPGEDTVLSLFEADDPATVRRVNEAADFPLDRITEVVDVASARAETPDRPRLRTG